jgi:hypothetical protein
VHSIQVVQKGQFYSELDMGIMGKMDKELVLCFERSRDPCMSFPHKATRWQTQPDAHGLLKSKFAIGCELVYYFFKTNEIVGKYSYKLTN